MKNDQDILDVLVLACKTILPEHMATELVMLLNSSDASIIPHKSTVSRYRLVLDTGYMCTMRDINCNLYLSSQGLPSRYMMADASKKGRTEWEVMCYKEMAGGVAVALWDKCARLIELRAQIKRQPSGPTPAQGTEIANINQYICDNVVFHIMPPAALGQQRQGLAYKIHCWGHSSRLEEHSWELVRTRSKTVMSFTTDMGSEMNMADAIQNFKWKNLVLAFGEMPIVDEAANNLQEETAAGADTDHIIPPDPQPGVEHQNQEPEQVFERAVVCPGLLHILHNATRDVLLAMPSYRSFFLPLFKGLVKTLNDYNNIVRAACFLDGEAFTYYDAVKKYKCDFVETRWGYVLNACIETDAVEAAMYYFDLAKIRSQYNAVKSRKTVVEGGQVGFADPGDENVDVHGVFGKANEFILSKAHWSSTPLLPNSVVFPSPLASPLVYPSGNAWGTTSVDVR